MKNDFGGLFVGWGEPIYVKLKEVKKLVVKHFKYSLQYHVRLKEICNNVMIIRSF